MDTAQEALFRDMLNNGWFTQSDGDVESPTGYFGYVVNAWGEYDEVRDNFSDTIAAYGDVAPVDFYGVYSACIDYYGNIYIHRHGDYIRTNTAVLGIEPTPVVREAMRWHAVASESYLEWASQDDEREFKGIADRVFPKEWASDKACDSYEANANGEDMCPNCNHAITKHADFK